MANIEVHHKTLNLTMDLISSRNIEEMVLVLKKEVSKTHNVEHAKQDTEKYRQLLVRTLHSCCIRFPDVAATVIPVLSEFLSDTNEQAATDVLIFICEAIQKFPHLLSLITEKLIETFPAVRLVKVHRAALWILDKNITSRKEILEVIEGNIGAMANIELHRKTLNLAMDLVSMRNIEEMVLVLKKEVSKTHNLEHANKIRKNIVN